MAGFHEFCTERNASGRGSRGNRGERRVASQGGSNFIGTIFTYDPTTSKITALVNFDDTNGRHPSGLQSDGHGNVYGTTQFSDPGGLGTTIYRYNAATGLTTLATFDGTNGEDPTGDLIPDGKGNFYGTTALGGSNKGGTLFKLSVR